MNGINYLIAILFYLGLSSNLMAHDFNNSEDIKWIKFIQKCSITLLGRFPTDKEDSLFNEIRAQSTDELSARSMIIDTMFQKKDFYKNIEFQLREEYLEGISNNILVETYLKDFFFLSQTKQESIYIHEFTMTFDNLFYIANVINGEFNYPVIIKDLQSKLINNSIYNQVNMGLDNFILSTFQHFIRRKPTKFEFASAKSMVLGQESILFLKTGSNKLDYIDILLDNPSYWEGQVYYWFTKINNRYPDFQEVAQYIGIMKDYKTPERVIKAILLNLNSF